jgi:hypothetical protein
VGTSLKRITAKAVAINLPKTGIEHAYMKTRPRFSENHREFEPIHCMNVSYFPLFLLISLLALDERRIR